MGEKLTSAKIQMLFTPPDSDCKLNFSYIKNTLSWAESVFSVQ